MGIDHPAVRTVSFTGAGTSVVGAAVRATVTTFAGPPLRIAVLHVPAGDSVMFAAMHHREELDRADIELQAFGPHVVPGIYGLSSYRNTAALDVLRALPGVGYSANEDSRVRTGLAEITLDAAAVAAFGPPAAPQTQG